MIWDSYYWKKDLEKTASWLKSHVANRRSPSEKICFEVQKCFFTSAYQVRKLMDSNKLSDSVADMALVLESYANIGNVNPLNKDNIKVLYNLNQPVERELKLRKICGLLIHSYVFVMGQNSITSPIKHIYFNSDSTKMKELYLLNLKDWIDVIDMVSSDYPNYYVLEFDKDRKHYSIKQETIISGDRIELN